MNTPNKLIIWQYTILWICISIISRIIPHPFNATAIISLSLWSPLLFNRYYGVATSIISLFLSDVSLHFFANYPIFGSWSLFTYSAIILLALLNTSKGKHMLLITIFGSLGFWLWTNFGTWLMTSDLYPKTLSGLATCYVAGLPFLKHCLISSLLYTYVLSWIYHHKTETHFVKT